MQPVEVVDAESSCFVALDAILNNNLTPQKLQNARIMSKKALDAFRKHERETVNHKSKFSNEVIRL